MLSVLVNIPALRRRVLWPSSAVGAIAGASGFALFIVLMWTEAGDERWLKLAGSFLVVAAGTTLASSLALITMPARFRWLQPVGDALITVLAVTALYGLWFEPDTEWYARLVGVEGVLVAALTLVVPVLSRFTSPRRQEANGEGIPPGPAAVRFCPSCGRPVAWPAGNRCADRLRCLRSGLRSESSAQLSAGAASPDAGIRDKSRRVDVLPVRPGRSPVEPERDRPTVQIPQQLRDPSSPIAVLALPAADSSSAATDTAVPEITKPATSAATMASVTWLVPPPGRRRPATGTTASGRCTGRLNSRRLTCSPDSSDRSPSTGHPRLHHPDPPNTVEGRSPRQGGYSSTFRYLPNRHFALAAIEINREAP